MTIIIAEPRTAMGKIDVLSGGEARPLLDWYCIDYMCQSEEPGFAWGDESVRAYRTAYAILREFYGKDMAIRYGRQFCRLYLARQPAGEGFLLTFEKLARIMDEVVLRDEQRRKPAS